MTANLEKTKFRGGKLFGAPVIFIKERVNVMEINKPLNGMYEDGFKLYRYELGYSDDPETPVEIGVKFDDENFYGTIITDTPLTLDYEGEHINKIGLYLNAGDLKIGDKEYLLPIWRKIRGESWRKRENAHM